MIPWRGSRTTDHSVNLLLTDDLVTTSDEEAVVAGWAKPGRAGRSSGAGDSIPITGRSIHARCTAYRSKVGGETMRCGRDRGAVEMNPPGRRAVSLIAAMVLVLAAGCGGLGGGKQFAVGDCLAEDLGQDGQAVEAACSETGSFTVEKLVRNGGAVTCGYTLNQPLGKASITDVVTGTSYCGARNGG